MTPKVYDFCVHSFEAPVISAHIEKTILRLIFQAGRIDIFSLIAFNIQEITMSNNLPSHSGRVSECIATKGKRYVQKVF